MWAVASSADFQVVAQGMAGVHGCHVVGEDATQRPSPPPSVYIQQSFHRRSVHVLNLLGTLLIGLLSNAEGTAQVIGLGVQKESMQGLTPLNRCVTVQTNWRFGLA